ncbi:MAG: heavy metal translocating P-type ATPase [Acidimicrobiales bacterium]
MAVETVQLKVSGLMCSFCTMSVEKALKRYPGVGNVMVNLVHGVVVVESDTARTGRDEIAAAVERLGYNVAATEVQQYQTDAAIYSLIKRRGRLALALAAVDVLVDPLNVLRLAQRTRTWFSLVVAAFVLVWVGWPILRKSAMAAGQRVINANVLLSTAAWGSFAVGVASLLDDDWPNFFPVASLLMALHLFFGFFKLDTRKKAAEAVRKLLSLQPPEARVLRGGQIVDVLTTEVSVGEVVVVRPGERIPLDGEVVAGAASVDQSSFTGESSPSAKTAGDEVIGGTLNLDGALEVQVTKVGEESFLAQIVRLMSHIAERKAPIELLADRLMNYYGPVVFAVAGAAFAAWAVVTGDLHDATLALLTTVIMGYPCALGITTPMLAAIAGGEGISIGLLVKASEVFHELSRVNTVVFDKTGTLTYGRPTVTDVVATAASRVELLAAAAAVEGPSEHPVGQAIGFYAQRDGAVAGPVESFRAVPGRGVTARAGGEEILAGKPSFMEDQGVSLPAELRSSVASLSQAGKTVVVVARAGRVLGVLALQDTPRRGAARTVAKLRQRGIRTVMLTGDARPVAEAIARDLGIDEVRAELLPDEKVAAIEELQASGRNVAMVGDGINDAPALVQANVGIAIAAGTDVAIESAGVILMSDRLDDLVGSLILGKEAYRALTGNVAVAVLFNIVGMALAAAGLVTPGLAITWMLVSIFAILLNTLRIRRVDLERGDEELPTTSLAEAEFLIPSMHCDGCASKITSALSPMAGVKDVRPKVPQKRVSVRYEPAVVGQEQLKETLASSGFDAVDA